MPVNIIHCNLFDAQVGALAHFCNCFHVMGAGVALQFRKKYPEILVIDRRTPKGSPQKLGSISYGDASDGTILINCYTQFGYGGKHETNYHAVYNSLIAVRELLEKAGVESLGLPYGAGCGLGGGSWNVVNAIIEEVFEKSEIEVNLCRYV